jgi:methionyl-tRNA formyltransferase
MKIMMLTTDTKHHRFFINAIEKNFKDVSVIFETRSLKKDYPTGPFFEKEQDDFNELFFKSCSRELSNKVRNSLLICKSVNGPKAASFLKEKSPDVCISFGTGRIKPDTIKLGRMGIINVHRGIIEKYRGLDSDMWAIINKDFSEIGTTIHWIDENLDTGPIISQGKYKIQKHDEIFHIQYHTTLIGSSLVIDALEKIKKEKDLEVYHQKELGKYYTAMSLFDKHQALKHFNEYRERL